VRANLEQPKQLAKSQLKFKEADASYEKAAKDTIATEREFTKECKKQCKKLSELNVERLQMLKLWQTSVQNQFQQLVCEFDGILGIKLEGIDVNELSKQQYNSVKSTAKFEITEYFDLK